MTFRISKLGGLLGKAKADGWADWIRNESDERAVLAGHEFDQQRADHIVQFFSQFLIHSEGASAGRPFVPMAWQENEVLRPLFGWIRYCDHFNRWVRRYQKAFVFCPKKNGKSPMGAGVGLYCLTADGERGGKVFSAAADREQAKIVHNHAVGYVEASPALAAECKINRTSHAITHLPTRSVYKAISSEGKTKEGLNGNCCILDELHVVSRQLWDALRYMFASRAQPLLFITTTAGDDELSVCYQQYEYAKAVAAGEIHDLTTLPVVYEIDEGDDIRDPEVMRKANPSLGVTVVEERLRQDIDEAENEGVSSFNTLRRYRFNVWTARGRVWIGRDEWMRNVDPDVGVIERADDLEGSIEFLEGLPAYAGLDLGQVDDLTAFALAWHDFENDVAWCQAWHWIPEGRVDKSPNRQTYRDWIEQGWLETTDGDVCDYAFVKRRIREMSERYQILSLVFDPHGGAEKLTQELAEGELGPDGQVVYGSIGCERYSMGPTMSYFAGPTKETERLIRGGLLLHFGNPILSWMFNNAIVKADEHGNIRPVKHHRDDPRKIDGVVSLVMAIAQSPLCTIGEGQHLGDGTL